MTHTTPEHVVVIGGGILGAAVGAILADGTRVAADRVVLATGPAVPAQLAGLGVTVPDATPAASAPSIP
jgi:phytoene dehydrogenase-like protein